jgi:hypothetical protein
LSYLNQFSGFVLDGLLRPFHSPWAALAAAALATSLLVLLVVRWTSSPAAVARARGRFMARVLELVLFRHDATISFTAVGRIVAANLAYLRSLLLPLTFSLVPCALILAQLSCWFDARPLRVGEAAVLEVKLRHELSVTGLPLSLVQAQAVQVETDGVRIPRLTEIDWRLRGAQPGIEQLEIHCGDEPPVTKQIVVGEEFQKVSRRRSRPGLWQQFTNPAEPPIDGGAALESVEVRYPARKLYLGNTEVNWLVAFLAMTIAFALVLKRPLKAEI